MNVQDIKLYLKVDHDDEDSFILSLQKAAEDYLYNAGCIKNYDNELYKHAIRILIAHWYDNRGLIGSTDLIKCSLESIIYQLKDTRIIDGEIDDK